MRSPIDAATFRALRQCGWTLIPLCRKDKRPIHNNWQKLRYNAAKVVTQCVKDGLNVGIRPNADQLVLDIDPRHGGTKSFERLCRKLKLDTSRWPCSITGSGGRHFFLTLPKDVRVIGKHKDYAGVEFKSVGQQVVAPGSRHPNGTLYEWDWLDGDRLPLAKAPRAPAALIDFIRRPEAASGDEPGEYTPDQIARMLETIDVETFRKDEQSWRDLMMAVHFSSGGAARVEFIEWSISDPHYKDDAEKIGKRWDSLNVDKPGSITGATLRKFVQERGDVNTIPPDCEAADDFEPVSEEDFNDEELAEALAIYKQPPTINDVTAENIDDAFSLTNVSGKARILYWGSSQMEGYSNARVAEFMAISDFRSLLANKSVVIGEGDNKKRRGLADYWLSNRKRKTYDGLIFDSKRDDPNKINLWRGFSVEPKAGNWKLMERHIQDIVATGDAKSAEYIIRWVAWGFQNPTFPAEVVLALMSKERGTGKGALAREIALTYGVHGLHIHQRNHLVGKFNAHFAQCALLFADEVLWPGAKEAEGIFKGLITEPTLTIEPKGVNAFTVPNALKIIMASNEDWVLPAARDERRAAVFEVSPKRKQDFDYFRALANSMKLGGRAAMLHDMLQMDLKGWHPRRDIPQTAALAGQKKESAEPEIQWLAGLLEHGVLPGQKEGRSNVCQAGALYDRARSSTRGLMHWSDNRFADFLTQWGVTSRRSNGSWRVFPPLQTMRAKFLSERPWWGVFNPKIKDWAVDAG